MQKMIDEAIDILQFAKKKYIDLGKSILGIFNPMSGRQLGEDMRNVLDDMEEIYERFAGKEETKDKAEDFKSSYKRRNRQSKRRRQSD